jgi:hypothetical protein
MLSSFPVFWTFTYLRLATQMGKITHQSPCFNSLVEQLSEIFRYNTVLRVLDEVSQAYAYLPSNNGPLGTHWSHRAYWRPPAGTHWSTAPRQLNTGLPTSSYSLRSCYVVLLGIFGFLDNDVKLLKPNGYYITTRFNIPNSALCSQSVFVCFVRSSQ